MYRSGWVRPLPPLQPLNHGAPASRRCRRLFGRTVVFNARRPSSVMPVPTSFSNDRGRGAKAQSTERAHSRRQARLGHAMIKAIAVEAAAGPRCLAAAGGSGVSRLNHH